ncbi:MAG: hypothetical protein Q3982_01320 [Phoenicibacter congonensis]|uniref:Uncharacterized protein n=1 Tax=Phoenicibacter congonensis TaxID=1944646 RepID=A0AA43UB05_9ACTN|nr:hypothetical protein [Phoenicibacter congonensis]
MLNQAKLHSLLKSKLLLVLLPLVLFALLCVTPNNAYADFSVYVGYSGGPYYKKTVYSDADMVAMSTGVTYEYSAIDQMPAVRKGYGKGVLLSQFFSTSGIDTSVLKRFYFSTTDGYVADDGVEGYGAWYYQDLCVTPLYYYPYLFEGTEIIDGKTYMDQNIVFNDAQVTPTIIAYEWSFQRAFSQSEWDSPNWKSEPYRLMLGQESPIKMGGARASAQNVLSMTCIFNGTPEISFGDKTSFEGNVGDIISITPTVKAADSLIEENAVKDLKWEISDNSVAEFVKDANGNLVVDENGGIQIRLKKDGNVTLTASYGNSPSEKYIAKASISGGTGKGDGSGDGDGKGDGSGDGSGSGDGGKGSGSGGNRGTSDQSIIAGGDGTTELQQKSGEAASGTSDSTEADGGGGSESASASSLQIKALSQAWLLDTQNGEQNAMIDDPLLIARPAALAVILFGCFVLGVILRVVACERAKDPYVDKRISGGRTATSQA